MRMAKKDRRFWRQLGSEFGRVLAAIKAESGPVQYQNYVLEGPVGQDVPIEPVSLGVFLPEQSDGTPCAYVVIHLGTDPEDQAAEYRQRILGLSVPPAIARRQNPMVEFLNDEQGALEARQREIAALLEVHRLPFAVVVFGKVASSRVPATVVYTALELPLIVYLEQMHSILRDMNEERPLS